MVRRPDDRLEELFDALAPWFVLVLVVVLWLIVAIDAYRGMVGA